MILPWRLLGGLVLGHLRWRSGSVYPCIVAHALFNASFTFDLEYGWLPF